MAATQRPFSGIDLDQEVGLQDNIQPPSESGAGVDVPNESRSRHSNSSSRSSSRSSSKYVHLVPHQMDFHRDRLCNRGLLRHPQVRITLVLDKPDGCSYRLNSAQHHYIEGFREDYSLAGCRAFDVVCRAAGKDDAAHKYFSLNWHEERPMGQMGDEGDGGDGGDGGSMGDIGDDQSEDGEGSERAVVVRMRWVLLGPLPRLLGPLLPDASGRMWTVSSSNSNHNDPQPDDESLYESMVGLDLVNLRRGVVEGNEPVLLDALAQIERVVARVGRGVLPRPLRCCQALVSYIAAGAKPSLRLEAKGRMAETLVQFLVAFFQRDVATAAGGGCCSTPHRPRRYGQGAGKAHQRHARAEQHLC